MGSLAGKRVLLTGASGFLGASLCRRLVNEGATVSGISRSSSVIAEGVTHHQCDVCSFEDLQKVFYRVEPEIVFHLAGYVSGSRDIDAVIPSLYGNLVGTVNLLVTCVKAGGCRLVLTNSLEEPDPDNKIPVSPYAAAKGASTNYARMFHSLYGLPASVARISLAYGPNQPSHQLIPYVALSLMKNKAPRLSSGERIADWIFVDDVIEGLLRMGMQSEGRGEIIDIGSGQLVSVREIVERIAQKVNASVAPIFGALPDRPRERSVSANIDASEKQLHWRPEISLDEGLERTINWTRMIVGSETV